MRARALSLPRVRARSLLPLTLEIFISRMQVGRVILPLRGQVLLIVFSFIASLKTFYWALSEWRWCLSGFFFLSLGVSSLPSSSSERFRYVGNSRLRNWITWISMMFLPREEQYICFLFTFSIVLEGYKAYISERNSAFENHITDVNYFSILFFSTCLYLVWYASASLVFVFLKWIVV